MSILEVTFFWYGRKRTKLDFLILKVSLLADNQLLSFWSSLFIVASNFKELISFDVVSLFTSIPTDVAVRVAKSRLDKDQQLAQRTQLKPSEISTLLSEFCLNSTEFQWGGKFYQQIHGTAMVSPVYVVVANHIMEDLE